MENDTYTQLLELLTATMPEEPEDASAWIQEIRDNILCPLREMVTNLSDGIDAIENKLEEIEASADTETEQVEAIDAIETQIEELSDTAKDKTLPSAERRQAREDRSAAKDELEQAREDLEQSRAERDEAAQELVAAVDETRTALIELGVTQVAETPPA